MSAPGQRPKNNKHIKPFFWISFFLTLLGRPFYFLIISLFSILFFAQEKIVELVKIALRFLAQLSTVKSPKLSPPKVTIKKLTLPHFSIHFRLLSFVFLLSLGYLSSVFYISILKDLPNPRLLTEIQPKLTTEIQDRNGETLYRIYQDENRSLVKLDDIPLQVRQATIAIEDKDFYQHQGFSLKGILRAFERNLTSSKLEGGSTITQQLIKNTLLSSEKTFTRKIKEVILAVHTELIFNKDTILEMYLNQVPYGGTAYGIEAAAKQYFNHSVKDLTLAQAALLAGLPQAPTKYSPYGIQPQLALIRQHLVLDRMLEDGYITIQQHDQATKEKLVFSPPASSIKAPHFVMYVKDLLVKQYGEELVNHGGLIVHTTLDLNIQNQAQKIVSQEVSLLENYNVNNGAALVLNPKTGEILAMVGSKNYFDINNDGQVNLTLSLRQPGSSVKPINYALAFEKGAHPTDYVLDAPITISTPGAPSWSPQNYDHTFHGNVTLRTALANSYNIPAVKLLAQNGVNQMAQLAQSLGITTWDDPTRLGLSLTLGSVEVRMIDLAKAYSTFANLGETININPILSVTTPDGKTLPYDPCIQEPALQAMAEARAVSTCQSHHTISAKTAYVINDILSDRKARSAAFGYNSILNIPNQQVAVKTGTSNDLKDNWTFGYTPNVLVATWVGNNDSQPMNSIASGITGASPIWSKIMTFLLKNESPQQFTLPDSLIKVDVCSLTNTLPCSSCPYVHTEVFVKGTAPTQSCTEEQIKKILENKYQQKIDSTTKLTQQTISPHPDILDGASTNR